MRVLSRHGRPGEWHAVVQLDNGMTITYTIHAYNRPTDAEFLALATAQNEYNKIMEAGGVRNSRHK